MAAVQRASVCFFWRAHCRMSQRGLGNGLCWPCQPCAAQPPWHAPPPPPHLSYPRPRLHTTPPAQLAALGRARDGRSPGRPPLNRSPPPRRGVWCYVRCMRGPGRHNRLLGAPHSCGTLGVATITGLWPEDARHMQRHAHHHLTRLPTHPQLFPKELSASPSPKCQRPARRASRQQTPRYRLWPRDGSHGAP